MHRATCKYYVSVFLDLYTDLEAMLTKFSFHCTMTIFIFLEIPTRDLEIPTRQLPMVTVYLFLSGADIANVCNEAAIYAATNNKDQVTMADMDYALQRIIGGPEKRSFVRDAREKKINAYYEAGRAVVSWLTRTSDAILKVN